MGPPAPRRLKKQDGGSVADIFSLPDELLLKIIKMVADDGTNKGTEEGYDDTEYSTTWLTKMPHYRPYLPPTTPCEAACAKIDSLLVSYCR